MASWLVLGHNPWDVLLCLVPCLYFTVGNGPLCLDMTAGNLLQIFWLFSAEG
jgi:hypothetical protein